MLIWSYNEEMEMVNSIVQIRFCLSQSEAIVAYQFNRRTTDDTGETVTTWIGMKLHAKFSVKCCTTNKFYFKTHKSNCILCSFCHYHS